MLEVNPLQGQAFWRSRVNLDGTDFLLDFAWNGRFEAWMLTLLTSDETILVAGLTVVSNRPLFDRFKHTEGMPAGELIAVDLTATVTVPGYAGLGDPAQGGGGVRLFYFEALLGEWA